jgi:hypothetical protein
MLKGVTTVSRFKNGGYIQKQEIDMSRQFPIITIMNVEIARKKQRDEGSFDCYGKATCGYCDQFCCVYHDECLDASQALLSFESS